MKKLPKWDVAVLQAYYTAAKNMGQGAVASYIPALADIEPHLAVAVTDLEGYTYSTGASRERFTIQSISKVLILAAALEEAGFKKVFCRVGMEPTGDAFNSIVRLETSGAMPSNPMINAGAIAVTSCIQGKTAEERFNKVRNIARRIFDSPELDYDVKIYHSELQNSARNQALAYMLEAGNVISGSVSEHLEVYLKACSLLANCEEISYLGAVLANNGVSPRTGAQIIEAENARTIRALMTTCGLYDYSGEFAVRVGIPAKSGVGGGIMCAVPNRAGIGTYCPLLDSKGNSICGLRALERLSEIESLSIF